MNPALNDNVAVPQGSVQVMNVLDVPANNNSTLEQLMTVDAGYLQGLPVSMLDWGAYSKVYAWFSRRVWNGADCGWYRPMGQLLLALQ